LEEREEEMVQDVEDQRVLLLDLEVEQQDLQVQLILEEVVEQDQVEETEDQVLLLLELLLQHQDLYRQHQEQIQ
jgi:hypothetical protein